MSFLLISSLFQNLSACSIANAKILDEEETLSVYDKSRFSIVCIASSSSQNATQGLTVAGSGVVWDQYGHIVTNYHCVSKANKNSQVLKVAVQAYSGGDGGSILCDAKVQGIDTLNDIAVLTLLAPDTVLNTLTPIAVSTSTNLKVGQSVYALGNINRGSNTLSAGIVSGLNRSIPSPIGARIYGAIQTDALINTENSGGPLLNSAGRLVGLSTAPYSQTVAERGSGISFALPSDLLVEVVPKLILYGNPSGKRV